jgi:hypothetical protein
MILLDKLDHMQNSDPHWALTSPTAMIAATICTLAVRLHLDLHLHLLVIQGSRITSPIILTNASPSHARASSRSSSHPVNCPEVSLEQLVLEEQHHCTNQHHIHLKFNTLKEKHFKYIGNHVNIN